MVAFGFVPALLLAPRDVSAQPAPGAQCRNPDADPRSCVYDDGSINLEVNFRLPPLPVQVEHIKEQFRQANRVICDATDGNLRFGTITLTFGDGQHEDADIWWYPQGGRASSGSGLSDGAAHFTMYGYGNESDPCPPTCDGALAAGMPGSCDPDNDGTLDGCDHRLPAASANSCDLDRNGTFDDCGNLRERLTSGATGHLIAHELGHLVFQVGDQYPEQNRFGLGCGIGPGFDGNGFWSTHDGPVAMTAAQRAAATPETDVERNHTIMQQTGAQVCRDTATSSFSYFDKFPDFAGRVELACMTDDDCQFAGHGGYGLGPDWVCDAGATLMSELSIDANQDVLRGTNFTAPGTVASCASLPGALEAREVMFAGRLLNFGAARCGNGDLESDEQCDPALGGSNCTALNVALGTNFTGGFAPCASNCTFDLTGCTVPGAVVDLCSNGVLDPGELCVPGSSSTCVAIKGSGTGGGNAACGANCAWQTGTCSSPSLTCGNGVQDDPFFGIGGEQCDGADLNGASCAMFGFTGGTLACGPNCYFDFSGCTRPPPAPAPCGNGVLDAGEQCDASSGAALPSCTAFGADRTGTVGCSANCSFDTSGCTAVEWSLDTRSFAAAFTSPGFGATATEVYDGIDQIKDETSMHALWSFSAGHSDSGAWTFVIGANREEYVDVEALCGNGTVDADAGEECEAGQTQACTALAGGLWNGGTATCAGCLWDDSGCTTPVPTSCGDGVVTGDEECDGAISPICAELGLEGSLDTPLPCRPNCSVDTSSCTVATLVELARYHVVFDPGTGAVAEINGLPYPASMPTIELGGTATPAPYGTLPDGSPGGQITGTGAFLTAGHPARTLTLNFDELLESNSVPTPDGTAHYFQRYAMRTRFGEVAGNDVPARGTCATDFDCQFGWNVASQRFETTHDTLAQIGAAIAANPPGTVEANPGAFVFGEWSRTAQVMNTKWGLTTFAPPAGRPDARLPGMGGAPGTCGVVDFDDADVETPSQVVLVLDRSGSMSQEDAGGPGVRQRRLDFVKAAARAFVDLYSDATRPADQFPDVGLVWFNHEPFTAFGQPGALRKLVRGTCGSAGSPCPMPNEIGHEFIKTEFLRDEDDPAGENPVPEGLTSIGAAIRAAGELLPTANGALQGIVLLSDGENNPPGGVTDSPLAEADALLADPEKHVRFFTVPAVDGDAILNTELARKSGGEMFPVDSVDQLPPRFMDSFARQRGEALAVDRAEVAVLYEPPCDVEFCPEPPPPGSPQPSAEVTLPVEPGAQRLNVLISTRNGDPHVVGKPDFELRNPLGTVVRDTNSAGVADDPYYRVVSVVAPMPGDWTLRVIGTSHGGVTASQYSFVTAHVENPYPDCFASAVPGRLQDGGELLVTAHALWGREIRSGATITGEIIQPDKSAVPLSFGWSDVHKAFVATVHATTLTSGKGGYEVRVRCQVEDGAELLEGEDPYGQYPAVPSNAVEAFTRSASVWFHFDSTQPTALKPGGDADGDGIPDASEPAGDFDGDGLDEPWDSDSDNDDVPDSLDPGPFDPDVPYPGGIHCTVDGVPPVIVAPDVTVARCVSAPAEELLGVSATDESCTVRTQLDSFTGNLVSINGHALSPPRPIDPADPRVVLPAGTAVIEWRAVDVNGVPATRQQTITVNVDSEVATCCAPGQTLVEGNGFPNTILRFDDRPYCIFGRGAGDTIVTSEGADYLVGGTGSDSITSTGNGNVLIGGDGNDELEMYSFGSGTIYGGAGNDVVHDSVGGTIYGNAGDDFIETDFVAHQIIPGPGRDAVYGGVGDDTVIIYDVCETQPFETLNGGLGNDTLITPVPVATLFSRGVFLSGFEQVIVTTANSHLSECL